MSAAEPVKRASFLTVGSSSDFLKKQEKDTTTSNSKSKSLRLNLDLFEPDLNTFPEFNYKRLLHIEKKKQKKLSKLTNGNANDDPFGGGDEDDVAKLARELEQKYGTGSAYSKSSRLANCDRGAGYDENDSFIDNTEAYDELIPEEIETDRGGFYINSGALEFKKLSNYERPGDEMRMPKAKKRTLSTSSEDSESEANVELSKPMKKNYVDKKSKTATTSSSDEQGKAKKIKKDKPEKPKEVPKEIQVVKELEKKVPPEKVLESETSADGKKIIKTTTVKDMLRAKRDSLRKMEQDKTAGSGTTATTTDEDETRTESDSSLAVSESSRESHLDTNSVPVNGTNTIITTKEIKLPDSFPADLKQIITDFKQYVDTVAIKNANFFDLRVMDQLVKIDNVAKQSGASVRISIFNYLEQFIPCSKKNIFVKVRRHRHRQIKDKLKGEIKKLGAIVTEAMNGLISKYDSELKQFNEIKNVQNIIGDTTIEQRAPRKKFHWSDASRQLLSSVVSHMQDAYKIVKPKSETVEEFVAHSLQLDVLPLWPEGWMKIEDIQKEMGRRKKKEARLSVPSALAATQSQVQSKPNTATTNGKISALLSPLIQKTDSAKQSSEPEKTVANGKAATTVLMPGPPQPSLTPPIIKRASDHSINSIISSPPPSKITALSVPNDVQKPSHKESSKNATRMPCNELNPEKGHRSESSDSDCVEIVDVYTSQDSKIPSTPVKQPAIVQNNNNNSKSNLTMTASCTSYQQPAKKSKKHDGPDEPLLDYQAIMMDIQSITEPKRATQQFTKAVLELPRGERKTETSSQGFDSTSDNEFPFFSNFSYNYKRRESNS